MYQFSKTSLKRLETCHKDIQTLMLYAILTSPIDFGIAVGQRTPEEQFKIYRSGRKKVPNGYEVTDSNAVLTNCDGFLERSKHNYSPSMAVDIYVWVPGKRHMMYDEVHLSFLAGHVLKCSSELLANGQITHDLTWGGNWDNDGELLYDQRLKDLPHFELSKQC
jgi:peptidoglycan L-alanyl-D-glutamate endopeptidase CwlK